MTIADYHREQHRKRLIRQQKESNDTREVFQYFAGLSIGIAIILAACILAVPQL